MKCTLENWQTHLLPQREIIYNASEHNELNDGYVPFTIGVSYLFATVPRVYQGLHEHLVFCAINEGTDTLRRGSHVINRCSILSTLAYNGIYNQHVPPPTYFQTLPTYKFVISPEGNGIDCHRHYEALLAGCIPIVEDHPWIRAKYEGCPVLYTRDYKEITPTYLETVYTTMLNTTYDFSKLFLSSYDTDIQNQIKDNGNYWGMRLLGIKWYQ